MRTISVILKKELAKLSNPKKAKDLAWYFKTRKGEYGYGDIFIGVMVPSQRKVAKKFFKDISLKETEALLRSKIHEHRLTALMILVLKYAAAKKSDDEKTIRQIVVIYLRNTKHINNWDLVDLSAPRILGDYYFRKDKKILYDFANSHDLWKKRIAIMTTMYFIDNGQFDDTLKIAKILLQDKHDLIHKAVGWMLREIGNRNLAVEEKFLKRHANTMPRTMLRYAIEKFDEKKRKFYLSA